MILVRSTIHLKGLALGEEVLVDPSIPYIAACLRAGYLCPASSADIESIPHQVFGVTVPVPLTADDGAEGPPAPPSDPDANLASGESEGGTLTDDAATHDGA